MAKKVYAVRKGKTPGIYSTWAQCQEQVHGFPGAQFKGFATLAQAEEYMGLSKQTSSPPTEAVAYVDGSYQAATRRFSCGVVILYAGKEEHLLACYDDPELAQMHNVAGEIKGSQKAIEYCLEHQIKSVTIFHDYEGIAKWCIGEWQAKKAGTQAYKAFYEQAKTKMDIRFVKVKGHSGDRYNDLADRLAKEAFSRSL